MYGFTTYNSKHINCHLRPSHNHDVDCADDARRIVNHQDTGLSWLTLFESGSWNCQSIFESMVRFASVASEVSVTAALDCIPAAPDVKTQAVHLLEFMLLSKSLPGTQQSFSFASSRPSAEQALVLLLRHGLVQQVSQGTYQISQHGLNSFRIVYRVAQPVRVFVTREDQPLLANTVLELLMLLTNAGWTHAIVSKVCYSSCAPYVASGDKRLYTAFKITATPG